MGVIHIENVDEKIMRAIELRARQSGRSFEEEVEALLSGLATDAPQPPLLSPKERAETFRKIREMTPKGKEQSDSTEMIREMRDRGYADY